MARLKNYFTIRDPYTYQGLSKKTTFRPILSGAKVPLTAQKLTVRFRGQVGMGRQRLERPERVGRLEWEITEREVQRRVRPSLVCHWFLNFF